MAVSLSIADVIDKNKIASENAWLILLTVNIRGDFGEVVETLHLVKNNENITYHGQLYTAVDFNVSIQNATNEEPSMTITAFDASGFLREKMEDFNGGIGSTVTMTVVNAGNLTAPPELQETFDVRGATAPDMNVEWTLGTENPLRNRFPLRDQYRDRCGFQYKGRRCKYSGPMKSCDYTKDGPNGCKAHNNLVNFGGFPSLMNNSG